jgi:hypothetical protein
MPKDYAGNDYTPRNHYVFLRPGEKIFILTDQIAGDTDYTHVIEAQVPSAEHDGTLYHTPSTGHIVESRQYQMLEMNQCLNLTSGGDDLTSAYARGNEPEDGRSLVSVPLSTVRAQSDSSVTLSDPNIEVIL